MSRQIVCTLLIALSHCSALAQADHFFVTIAGGDLYKVHIQACSTSFVGSTGSGFGDIAMTGSGALYGIVGGALYQIDTTTANTTYIGQSTAPGIALVALNNTTLLTEYDQDLYAISTLDASTTWIGNIGYGAIGDLTWFFEDLYMSAGGQLIRIASDDDFLSISSVSPVGTFDPQMPACEGLVTALVGDHISSIVGIRVPDLICISPFDGSYQTICQPALPDGVPGAAWAPPILTPDNGCGGGGVGLGDPQVAQHMQIRMAHGLLELIMPQDGKVTHYHLWDGSGRMILSAEVPAAQNALVDLKGLATGLYAIEATSVSQRFVERFTYMTP